MFVAKSGGYRRSVAVLVALALLSVTCNGTAFADPDKDAGTSRNQSRGQADRSTGTTTTQPGRSSSSSKHAADLPAYGSAKVQPTIRDVEDLADAKVDAAIRDMIEDTSSFVAPVAMQVALGPGGPVPTVGMAGLVPNARALVAYIANTYPSVQAIGGVRADPIPDHPSGRAIDIMIGSDMGLGDAINADVQRQAGRFGVVYSLWRVPNHFNHVHVTVS